VILLGLVLIGLQGALCWIGLRVVKSFGAWSEEQQKNRAEAWQLRLVLNDSMLLLHQYYMVMLQELKALQDQRKDAA
jgi:hypothetical protein